MEEILQPRRYVDGKLTDCALAGLLEFTFVARLRSWENVQLCIQHSSLSIESGSGIVRC